MKGLIITVIILAVCITILGLVFALVVSIQHSTILKLKADQATTAETTENKIKQYELEVEKIQQEHNELVEQLKNAKSIADYIIIQKKINEEIQR